MSKLDRLINELCPNGVEYKKIGEICVVLTGGEAQADAIKNKEPVGDKIYPIYSNGIGDNSLWGFSSEYRVDRDAVTFSSIGTIGFPTIRKAKFTPIIRLKVLYPIDDNKLNLSFLKYALEIVEFEQQKSSVPNINANMIKTLEIPVPPLPIQEEIVRILDNFTKLTAELTAELQDRKKQYEYYRDNLLTFKNDVKKVKLKDVAISMFRGGGITRDQVTETGYPCVRYGEIYTTYNTYFDKCVSHTKLEEIVSPKFIEYGDLLFAITGESIEDIGKTIAYVGNEKCLVGGDILVMRHNQNPKYLSYALATNDAVEQKGKGKVKSKVVHANAEAIGNIEIYLPSLEIQERIVSVLDNFEKICNDLKIGLPAEIELRQKQYEYYRDLLLTFPDNALCLSKQA